MPCSVEGWSALYVFVGLFESRISLLSFSRAVLSVAASGVLKPPTVVELTVSSSKPVDIFFQYFEAPTFGANMFMIATSFWLVDSFVFTRCPSLSFLMFFT